LAAYKAKGDKINFKPLIFFIYHSFAIFANNYNTPIFENYGQSPFINQNTALVNIKNALLLLLLLLLCSSKKFTNLTQFTQSKGLNLICNNQCSIPEFCGLKYRIIITPEL